MISGRDPLLLLLGDKVPVRIVIWFCKWEFPLFPAGLIPMSRPSGTLWSWKKEAVDSVSRFEDEKEEKLGEGISLLYGSGSATAAVGSEFCASLLSLMLMFPSPSGHPFVASPVS